GSLAELDRTQVAREAVAEPREPRLLVHELEPDQRVSVGDQCDRSDRGIDGGEVQRHDCSLRFGDPLLAWSDAAPVHSAIVAWARQGRERSARSSISRSVGTRAPRANALRTPRSPATNASGSPNARIAT